MERVSGMEKNVVKVFRFPQDKHKRMDATQEFLSFYSQSKPFFIMKVFFVKTLFSFCIIFSSVNVLGQDIFFPENSTPQVIHSY